MLTSGFDIVNASERGLQTATRLKPVDDFLEVLDVLAGKFLLDILSLAV
jgi:hypothetical protein